MCSDRRVVSGTEERTTMAKIAKNKWLIAAVAGTASCGLDVRNAIRKGARVADDLVDLVDHNSYALVLLPDGKRWRLEEKKLWPVHATEPEAIGSGANAALGWLAGYCFSYKKSMAIEPWMAREAQRFVAARRIDCGDGVDFRSFSSGGA